MNWLIAPILITLAAQTAAAADCVERNLETLPGSSMQKIPVYDQDSSGTCFAYAASELMNAYLLNRDPESPLRIHPAVAAIRYKRAYDPRAELSGGDVAQSIRAVRSGFNYRYDGVSEDLARIAGESGMSESEVLQMIELVGELMTDAEVQRLARAAAWRELGRSPNRRQFEDALRREVAGRMDLDLSASGSTCKREIEASYEGFIRSSSIASSVKIAGEALFSAGNRELKLPFTYLPKPEQVTALRNSNDWHAKIIREHFASGASLPLGISFCSRVIREGSLRAIEGEVGYMRRIPDMDKCEHHAALITGTRNNEGRCEYLLRNTWGSTFTNDNRLSCVCRHRMTREFSECPGNGRVGAKPTAPMIENAADLKVISCWIAEDEITPNMTGITRLR